MTTLLAPISSGVARKAVCHHLSLSPSPLAPHSTHLSAAMSQLKGCHGMLSSLCWGLAELPSPDVSSRTQQHPVAPLPAQPASDMAPCAHQDPTADSAGPGHQQCWQPLPHTHCCVSSSLVDFTGFMSPGQFLTGTGCLIATNQDLLQFSQMTPKKTSGAANPVAATPNPASGTLTTPLCLPCIRGSEHPASCSVSVPAAQAAGNPHSHPGADLAPHGAVRQHVIPFPIFG